MSSQHSRGSAEFADLVRPEVDRLVRAAVLLCGDWHQAEDLVQSVLARFYAGGRWRKVEHPYAYLRQAVTHEFLSGRRRRSASEVTMGDLPDDVDEGPGIDLAGRLDLLRALGRLSRSDRAVVILRYWDDLSVNEVAQILNASPGAVRTRSGRAVAKLRAALAGDAAPEPGLTVLIGNTQRKDRA